jgi:molecular chaperone HtpG
MTDTATNNATGKETLGFQTEVKQMLHLMIHSLYSNKEIFLRELISNASDACDKLRFEAVQNDALYEGDSDLKIHIDFDKDAGTITLTDNGIGMNREEVIANIGTIARSGTKAFMENMTGDQKKDSALIGQFGVGFYSSFIIADKVTLTTRKAGEPMAIRWESAGEGDFTLEEVQQEKRGTEIVLHLREGEEEFLDRWRLNGLIHKYSDHIAFPIYMLEYVPEPEADEDGNVPEKKAPEWEKVNKGAPLWTRAKNDIKEDEYKEFYKHVSHDYGEPMTWLHNRVEGTLEYTTLFYIPEKAPFDLYDRDSSNGIKLFVQRVFIMEDSEKLMPKYLRFIRGVVDSADLPLNVSREILQGNKVIDTIKSGSTKKILSTLQKMADKEPEKYQQFWDQFGAVLKEGPGEDFSNKEAIAKLLRFATTQSEGEAQTVSLAQYIERMKDGQDKIYYITADSYAAAKNSPHLEILKKKEIEVLLLSDRVDEWLVSHLHEFDGKQLTSVAKGDLDLGDTETEEEKKAKEETEKGAKELVERIQKSLDSRVKEVKVTHRLTDSPACIVADQFGMSANLARMLKEAGQAAPDDKPTLEINPTHPLVKKLDGEADGERFNDWASIVLDQAILAEGGKLDDPGSFVQKLNKMVLDIAS